MADAQATQAQSDLTIAYNDAAGQAPDASVTGDLVGRTLLPGVYNSSGPLAVTGGVTLDGQGDPNSVFIIQVASTLTTGVASNINVVNGAQACNIYWQVGSSATLGTGSSFQGTILALASITVTTGTTIHGRVLARNGQVSLDSNTFTSPVCQAPLPSPTASPTPTPTPTPTVAPTSSTISSGSPTSSSRPSAQPTAPKTSARPKPSTPEQAPGTGGVPNGAGAGAGPGTSAGAAAGAGASGTSGSVPVTSPTDPQGRPTPTPTPTRRLAQTGVAPPLTLGISLLAAGIALVAVTRRHNRQY